MAKPHGPSGCPGDVLMQYMMWCVCLMSAAQPSHMATLPHCSLSAQITQIIWSTSAALPPRAECVCAGQPPPATRSLRPGPPHCTQHTAHSTHCNTCSSTQHTAHREQVKRCYAKVPLADGWLHSCRHVMTEVDIPVWKGKAKDAWDSVFLWEIGILYITTPV